MRVIAITRHPVKLLRGESLIGAELDALGLRGDRHFGIRDELTGKKFPTGCRGAPALLMASARLTRTDSWRSRSPTAQWLSAGGCRRTWPCHTGSVTLSRLLTPGRLLPVS